MYYMYQTIPVFPLTEPHVTSALEYYINRLLSYVYTTSPLTTLWLINMINDDFSSRSSDVDGLSTTDQEKVREEILIWVILTDIVIIDGDIVAHVSVTMTERQLLIHNCIIVIIGN